MPADFVISQSFAVPRERMFTLWTDVELLKQWFGPAGVTVPQATMDLRPGGSFHFCMQSPDGTQMWGKWVFKDISPPGRLVWLHSFADEAGHPTRHPMSPTWPLTLLSTVTFDDDAQPGHTLVTVHWATHDANPAEQATFDMSHPSMQMGWVGTFMQLQAFLAKS
jgi:uncharacterized protein YndB with AHSA1/START domain